MIFIQNHLENYGNIVRDIPAINYNGNIVGFNGAITNDSFNFETKITSQTDNNKRIDNVEIMVPLNLNTNLNHSAEPSFVLAFQNDPTKNKQ